MSVSTVFVVRGCAVSRRFINVSIVICLVFVNLYPDPFEVMCCVY